MFGALCTYLPCAGAAGRPAVQGPGWTGVLCPAALCPLRAAPPTPPLPLLRPPRAPGGRRRAAHADTTQNTLGFLVPDRTGQGARRKPSLLRVRPGTPPAPSAFARAAGSRPQPDLTALPAGEPRVCPPRVRDVSKAQTTYCRNVEVCARR